MKDQRENILDVTACLFSLFRAKKKPSIFGSSLDQVLNMGTSFFFLWFQAVLMCNLCPLPTFDIVANPPISSRNDYQFLT